MATEYKLIYEKDQEKFNSTVSKLLSSGWQFVAPELIITKDGYFCREFILDSPDQEDDQPDEINHMNPAEFSRRWENMDQKVRDLLYVNDVWLFVTESGSLMTQNGDTVEPGIVPSRVLELVMKGGHVPIDLDREKFIQEIGKLIA